MLLDLEGEAISNLEAILGKSAQGYVDESAILVKVCLALEL